VTPGGSPVGIYTKHGNGLDPQFFAVEAAGLRWLAAAGPEAARVVRVLEVGSDHLVLERLHAVEASRTAAEEFGRALVRTHDAGAPAFGSPPAGRSGDGYIGRQAMTLRESPHWGTFYAEQRLLPYARTARDRGHLSAAGADLVDAVCTRLVAGDFDDGERPSRLHGDLWAGNVVHTADGVVLIDPAAHGGHRLTDLAMLALFGTPHLDAVLGAYAETAGLAAGWEDLVGLHQLHPLLVHAASHGPSYGAEAEQVARRYAG
jgi:fructosamine-3-kinase